jgi:3-deoxy-manno-octulosonate cytidylyltransferase (CMP-KDO synthetase)
MRTLAVIPARLGSTRLSEKVLMKIRGVPLVVRVLRAAQEARSIDRLIVATDSERVAEVVRAADGEAILTPAELASGGDRVAYTAELYPEYDAVLNIQSDDPLVRPEMIDPLVGALEEDSSVGLAVLAKIVDKEAELDDPSIVKMVFAPSGRALYFSRSRIPYPRVPGILPTYKHIGPYAYRRDFLLEFATWPQTPLERAESLEMLRVLEKGRPIVCVQTPYDTIEVDTPADVIALEAWIDLHGEVSRP